jgi:hypothetical protein
MLRRIRCHPQSNLSANGAGPFTDQCRSRVNDEQSHCVAAKKPDLIEERFHPTSRRRSGAARDSDLFLPSDWVLERTIRYESLLDRQVIRAVQWLATFPGCEVFAK